MEKRYFGLESISVNKLERLKWNIEEFLTTDLQALPHIQRNAFIEQLFRHLFMKQLKDLTAEETKQYQRCLKRWGV